MTFSDSAVAPSLLIDGQSQHTPLRPCLVGKAGEEDILLIVYLIVYF